MKKAIYLFAFVLTLSFAGFSIALADDAPQFNVSLKYGSTDKFEVTRLQNFLVSEGLLNVAPTGNFFSLTQNAVIEFQKTNGITPASGYFGPLTRAVANQKVLAMKGGYLVAEISARDVSAEQNGLASAISSNMKTVRWQTNNYPTNAGVNINLLKKTSESPVAYSLIRTLATDTLNDGQESWLPLPGEDTENIYIEVTCSNTYKFKSGCRLGGTPIKVN
jgi:hypothetical protein